MELVRMGKSEKPKNGPTDAEKREKWREYYDAALTAPLKWFHHDVTASDDPDLCQLRDAHGMEALGRWWVLVELIASARGHALDVSTPQAWARLAGKLEFYGPDAVEECRAFVGALYDLDLINRESFEEFGRIRSRRIDRTAEQAATDAANGALGPWVREWNRRAS